jgi:hypothetical protein
MLTQLQIGDFLRTLHNPRYINPDHTGAILLDGNYNGLKMEFFASPTDPMDYGRNTYQLAIEGHYGPIADYTPPSEDLFEREEK